MDRNSRLAELMGLHYHTPYIYKSGEESLYRCADPECCWHKMQCNEPLWRDNPDFTLPEWRARLMDFCVGQEWWGDFLYEKLTSFNFIAYGEIVHIDDVVRDLDYLWRNLPALVDSYWQERGK